MPVVIRTGITNPKVAIFFMQSANEGVDPDKADTEQSLFCFPLSAGVLLRQSTRGRSAGVQDYCETLSPGVASDIDFIDCSLRPTMWAANRAAIV